MLVKELLKILAPYDGNDHIYINHQDIKVVTFRAGGDEECAKTYNPKEDVKC